MEKRNKKEMLRARSLVRVLLLSVLLLSLLPSCEEIISVGGHRGGEITFSASTAGPLTKTIYSNVLTDGNTLEPIYWVAGDKVRILSKEALPPENVGSQQDANGNTYSDYMVSGGGTASVTLKPANSSGSVANGLCWGDNVTHYLYAVYPVPGSGAVTGVSTSGASGATVSLSIPSVQPYAIDSTYTVGGVKVREFFPDMNYAPMAASWSTIPADTSKVRLMFQPMMTTLRFEFKAVDDQMANTVLQKVSLNSAHATLAGSVTAGIKATSSRKDDLTASLPGAVTDGKDSIVVNLPAGTKLSKTDVTAVTFLCLPVEQKEMTLVLTFAGGVTRSLRLNRTSGDIVVEAFKKTYFRELGVTSASSGWTTPYNPGNHGIVSDDFAFTVTPSTATLWTTEYVTLSASSSALPAPTYGYERDNTYVTLSTTSGASTVVTAGTDAGRSVVTVKAKRGDDTNTKEFIFPVVVRKLESVTLLPTLRIPVGAYPSTLTPDVRYHNGTNSNQPYYGNDWTWSVLDPNTDTEVTGIVTVSKGVVTALAPGTVRVRCSITKGGITEFDDCLVTVEPSGTPEAYNVTGNGGIQ